MPPSPATRRSPSREMRVENHKRGRSLEVAPRVQEKDDDLALFNEMQAHEREDFLLQSSDDFEDAFSTKLSQFGAYKIRISIPAQGGSSDLLNTNEEKNDYEWLITPPETPLFPSLDDEPAPADVPPRGRTRSQPIAISGSSTMERSHRSSRASASPSRSSLSPQSRNSIGQSRGNPSSAPYTSPVSTTRSTTPSRRASPPPSRSSTHLPRSSSPTPRRMSTGSTVVRGMSPQKVSRGNSASPKIKAWQANIPGFSSDVPPNLRTSLADRPASYVRGSSPASRNGRDSSSKVNRQSTSPIATRSVSSSYSHEQDWFSLQSKGSMASSSDDDVGSLQSVTVGSLDQSTPSKVDMYSNNNRSSAYSRRSPKTSPANPKRSIDSVLRQMDNRKAPQNMFRPLLSSAPSTTFHVGNASSTYSITSQMSSITISSSMGSDYGRSALPDSEDNFYNHATEVGESGEMFCPDIQEAFAFDKADGEELRSELCGDTDRAHLTDGGPADSKDMEVGATKETAQAREDLSEVDNLGNTMKCSLCGCSYDDTNPMEMEIKLCQECKMKENLPDAIVPEALAVAADKTPVMSINTPQESEDVDGSAIVFFGCPEIDDSKDTMIHLLDDYPSVCQVEVQENIANGENPEQPTISSQELEHLTDYPNTKVAAAEGEGISLLLKRSSSSKGLVVQGRALSASNILPCDDFSYKRETAPSLRSSIGHRSFSSSSSIDLSSSKQTETRMQRQFSGKKSDNENCLLEVKYQSVGSSTSEVSRYSHQGIGLVTSTTSEVNIEGSIGQDMNDNFGTTHSAFLGKDDSELSESGKKVDKDSSALHLSSHFSDVGLGDDLLACRGTIEESTELENSEDLRENVRNETDGEESTSVQDATSETCFSALDEPSAMSNGSLVSTTEIDLHDNHQSIVGSEVVDTTSEPNNAMDEFQEPLEKDTNASTPEPVSSDLFLDLPVGESTVTVETRGRNRTRSMTLEEATDTILFCSSIVHDIAYSSATIAVEKEREVLEALEGFRPTVTIVDKSTSSSQKDPQSGRIISKRGLKPHSRAPRQKQIDNDKIPPSSKPENDENIDDNSITRNVGLPPKFDSVKPPKLESKCNCTIM